MIALLLFLVFGLVFGYFATVNTSLVAIHFGDYFLKDIPLYIVILVSFGVGVLFSSLYYFIKYVSIQMSLRKKEAELEELKKSGAEVMKKFHQSELENSKIKTKNGGTVDEDSI